MNLQNDWQELPENFKAHTIAEFIRQIVQRSVAPVSLEFPGNVRAELLRGLAQNYTIEHLLWRDQEQARAIERELQVLSTNNGFDPSAIRSDSMGEFQAGRADRMAIYGLSVDFVAASGQADSDLTQMLLNDFNIRLLPTQNPFSITFVRTVHGLSTHDLNSMKRYRAELEVLSPEERALIAVV